MKKEDKRKNLPTVTDVKLINSNKEFLFSNVKKAVLHPNFFKLTSAGYSGKDEESLKKNTYHSISSQIAKKGFWSDGNILIKKRIVN